jgi:hypothetical protein
LLLLLLAAAAAAAAAAADQSETLIRACDNASIDSILACAHQVGITGPSAGINFRFKFLTLRSSSTARASCDSMIFSRALLSFVLAIALLSGACCQSQDKSESHAHNETNFGLNVTKHPSGCWNITQVRSDSKASACHYRPHDLVCAVDGSPSTSDEFAALPQTTRCQALAVRKYS